MTGKKDWDSGEPATADEIDRLKRAAPFELPSEYLALLRKGNGGEGEFGLAPQWLQLWSVDEVIKSTALELYSEHFPGCFFFASNGGMESIAMRKSPAGQVEVVMIDAIAGIRSAEVIASDFDVFVQAIGKVYEA